MNPQFLITAITVALVLAASLLSKRPGCNGALVAALPEDLAAGAGLAVWKRATRARLDVDGHLLVRARRPLFFPVLSFSLKKAGAPWLCFSSPASPRSPA